MTVIFFENLCHQFEEHVNHGEIYLVYLVIECPVNDFLVISLTKAFFDRFDSEFVWQIDTSLKFPTLLAITR
jgi:hypothetical protein